MNVKFGFVLAVIFFGPSIAFAQGPNIPPQNYQQCVDECTIDLKNDTNACTPLYENPDTNPEGYLDWQNCMQAAFTKSQNCVAACVKKFPTTSM